MRHVFLFIVVLSVVCVVPSFAAGPEQDDRIIRINFTNESAPRASGYFADFGTPYDRHGNGLVYGWNRNKQPDTFYELSRYGTIRGDAHILVDAGDSWSIEVPNGWYLVHALSGNADTFDADYRFDVNGQPLLKGKPYPDFPFIEGLTTVNVTNGRITVSPAERAHDNRLNAIQIVATDPPVETPGGVSIDWRRDDSVQSPIGRVESAVVRMGDLLVVMGGFTNQYLGATNRVDVLNTSTGKWTRWADLPAPQTHIAAATDGRYIYAAGGQVGPLLSRKLTADVWRYDPSKNAWEPFGSLPAIRAGAQMQYLRGKLHVIGGNDETRVIAQASHYVLDLAKPRAGWSEAAALPVATDHHTSIVVNGELYVLGGEFDHGTSYVTRSDFFKYLPKTDEWQPLPDMPTPLSHQEAATLTDGKRILVIGGQANVQQISELVYSYDIERGEWQQHDSLPTPRKGGVAWLEGKKIHYFAGDDLIYGLPVWAYEGTIRNK